MAGTESARRLVDETWLRGSNGLLVVTRTRIERDRDYHTAFRRTVLDLFAELWPTDGPVEWHDHLEAVTDDIGRMPLDLLDDLVDALGAFAEASGSPQTAANGATRIIAGWLRTRAVEMRGEGEIPEQAERLRRDYPELLRKALSSGEAPVGDTSAEAHPVPPAQTKEAIRLDQLA